MAPTRDNHVEIVFTGTDAGAAEQAHRMGAGKRIEQLRGDLSTYDLMIRDLTRQRARVAAEINQATAAHSEAAARSTTRRIPMTNRKGLVTGYLEFETWAYMCEQAHAGHTITYGDALRTTMHRIGRVVAGHEESPHPLALPLFHPELTFEDSEYPLAGDNFWRVQAFQLFKKKEQLFTRLGVTEGMLFRAMVKKADEKEMQQMQDLLETMNLGHLVPPDEEKKL